MITERIFGEIKGIQVPEVTLHNNAGMEVSILAYGATIRSVIVPTADGKRVDVCLGYDTIEEYLNNSGHFGGSIGRFANRIGNAEFNLDGVHYSLAANTPPNHLHGGIHGWDTKIWNYDTNPDENSVTFYCKSADMEEGYPGEVHATAKFTVTEDNRMVIEYGAETDKATPVNMTNHWYFNMNGQGTGDVLGHTLQLSAEQITETDPGLVPTGKLLSVDGTAYDFRTPKVIGTDFEEVRKLATAGYDNNFVLGTPGEFKKFAVLTGDKTGLTLTAYTNMEAVQFYSGNHISARKGKAHTEYQDMSGMCLEPQHYPDCVNKPEFPSATLRPGEKYYHHIEFGFSG
ncbi:MAG: galactose mutarotase [Anaerolineaceae bacterium]|nr:galactose mutarotase [Anaerolineaceae bacterium]